MSSHESTLWCRKHVADDRYFNKTGVNFCLAGEVQEDDNKFLESNRSSYISPVPNSWPMHKTHGL